MKHPVRFFVILSIIFCVLFRTVPAVQAMDFRSSDKTVTVLADEMVHGTLFAAGSAIEIDGAVDGDVICAGQTITIRGPVSGDVICAGQTLRIDGLVSGNIRVAGQTIDVSGQVEKNATIFGQSLSLSEEASVHGDGLMGGQTISVKSDVGKGLVGMAGDLSLDSAVDGDAWLVGQSIRLGENAHITGTLRYESDEDAHIAQGATIGKVVKQPMRKEFKDMGSNRSAYSKPAKASKPWPVNAFVSILMSLVFGCLLVFLFPKKMEHVLVTMKEQAPMSFGVGFLFLIVSPVILIVLVATIIGIPFALLGLAAFIFMIFTGRLVAAILIGKEIVEAFGKGKVKNWYLVAAIGALVGELLFHMPFIGGLLTFLAAVWGTGALVKAFADRKSAKKAAK